MPNDPTKKSQEEKILAALRAGASLTALDALEQFGCSRLAARMNRLKNKGHEWTREFITNAYGVRFARYRMEGVPHGQ